MRVNNKDEVFKLIIQNKNITRNEIAEKLGISKMAVSKITKKLLENSYIFEKEKKESSGSGRKGSYLVVNKKNMGNILGIYFGLHKVDICVVDIDKNFILKESIKIDNFDKILEAVIKKVDEIVKSISIMIISIGMNGVVNNKTGMVVVSTYYHWINLPLKNIFEDKFGITTVIRNGVYLIALAQKRVGSCKENKNFAVLNVENGVGATIYRKDGLREEFKISEIGHTPFDYSSNALICVCGNKGCLETVMANWRIEERVLKETGEKYSYDEIIENANNNKSYFKNVLLDCIEPLSHVILWLNYIVSPEKILITGKITGCGKFFWQELNRYIKNNQLDKENELKIERVIYDENMILTGAVQSAFDNISDSIFIKNLFKGGKNE